MDEPQFLDYRIMLQMHWQASITQVYLSVSFFYYLIALTPVESGIRTVPHNLSGFASLCFDI